MNRLFRFLGAVLAAGILLSGCSDAPEETVPQTEPAVPARELYTAARETVENADNLVLDYTLRKQRRIGENTFTEHVAGKASFCQYGKQDMTAVVEQTLDFGVYSCGYTETFCKGMAYAEINGCRFYAGMGAGEFAARQVPAVLLAPELYGKVEYRPGGAVTQILFSQPKALEAWAGEGELLEASGTADLDGEGNLLRTSYLARYRTGQVEVTLELTVEVTAPESLELSGVHPDHEQLGVRLSNLDTPRRLVQVVADVYAAQCVRCEMEEGITSDAIPLSYSRSSRIGLKGWNAELSADTHYAESLTNYTGTTAVSSQTEQFQDGVYTICVDGSEPVRNGSVTARDMRQYCEDTILSGLLAVKYLKRVKVQEDGSLLRLELTGNDSYTQALTEQLMGILQVDLDAKAQSTQLLRSGGHLTLDTETGLPVSMGMYLEKSHTIDGSTYRLLYQLDETLSFAEES